MRSYSLENVSTNDQALGVSLLNKMLQDAYLKGFNHGLLQGRQELTEVPSTVEKELKRPTDTEQLIEDEWLLSDTPAGDDE